MLGDTLKVFSDYHHDDLFRSFEFLFKKRLDWELYRPIGRQWFTEGFWHIAKPYNDAPETVAQYLDWNVPPPDGTPVLNHEGKKHEVITLGEFRNDPPDILIASIPPHFTTFKNLRDKYAPKAKVVCHSGNNWPHDWSIIDNFMGSVLPHSCPKHHIFYHQEFDPMFQPSPPNNGRKLITSFLNAPQNFHTYGHWIHLQKQLPDWEFKEFGASSKDGVLDHAGIYEWMSNSRFIWQVKPGGDGYGHVLHTALAVGRPVITQMSDYYRTLGGQKLLEGRTCLNVDGLSPNRIATKVATHNQDDIYSSMHQAVVDTFKETVDFDAEAIKLKEFFEALI